MKENNKKYYRIADNGNIVRTHNPWACQHLVEICEWENEPRKKCVRIKITKWRLDTPDKPIYFNSTEIINLAKRIKEYQSGK